MTKRLNDIVGDSRNALYENNEIDTDIEQYIDYLADLTEEEIDEEIESLDELSRKAIGRYIKKASGDRAGIEFDHGYDYNNLVTRGTDKDKVDKNFAMSMKRRRGIHKAVDKLTGQARVNASEEVEQVDELSRETLGSYVDKATAHARQNTLKSSGLRAQINTKIARAPDRQKAMRQTLNDRKEVDRMVHKTMKRYKGIELAGKKLAKEEIETLDELSRKTLGSYVKKAADAVRISGQNQTLADTKGDYKTSEKELRRAGNKLVGIRRAADKLANEESETLDLGGYQPVPGAEKDFVSKHKVQKHADPAGNGDDVFKGSNVKKSKHTPNEKKGGAVAAVGEETGLTEAKAVTPTLAAKRALQGVADSIGKNKEGHLVARRGFFYRHGGTSEKFANEVSRVLTKAGVKHTVVDHEEHWAPFRGGASTRNSSHWAAHIHIHDSE